MNILPASTISGLKSSSFDCLKSNPLPIINKEELLNNTIAHLESERDSLLTTVADLRQLIKRITVQQDQESLRKRQIQQEYAKKIKALENALEVSEKNSKHLSCINDFWKDFIN